MDLTAKKALMKVYAKYERKGLLLPGYTKIKTDKIIRFVSQEEWGSFIAYYQLTPEELDEAISNEIRYFNQCGKNFEWKVYDTDQPKDIKKQLIAHGFTQGEAESFMVLDLGRINEPLPEYEVCVEVSDAQGIRDFISVSEKVWGGDHSGKEAYLLSSKKNAPESNSLYVIYQDGIAVSSARIEYNHKSPFAGIWGGSTLEEYRGRGYYSALLNKRINDAKKRGIQYLVIDASNMSRPIVEKYGFEYVTTTTPFEYVVTP